MFKRESGDIARFYRAVVRIPSDADTAAVAAAAIEANRLEEVTSSGATTDTDNFVQERIYGNSYPIQIQTNKEAADVEYQFLVDFGDPFQVSIMAGGERKLGSVIIAFTPVKDPDSKVVYVVLDGYFASPSMSLNQSEALMNTFMFYRQGASRQFITV